MCVLVASGDIAGAWQNNYVDDFVHSWVQVNISEPMYLKEVSVYETFFPGSVVDVSAFMQETNSYQKLWEGETQIVLLNPDASKRASGIANKKLCPSIYKSRQLLINLDLFSTDYWAGIDAVRVTGTRTLNSDVVTNPNR